MSKFRFFAIVERSLNKKSIFVEYFLHGFDLLCSKIVPERVLTISDVKNIFVVYWNTIDLFAALNLERFVKNC